MPSKTMTELNDDLVTATDLKSIGEILKSKREELSYTVEHVSEVTRISLSCLRNIEEGNLEALPGLVFTRGFIRNYAKLLGLESDWMIEALNQTYESQLNFLETSSEDAALEMPDREKRLTFFILGGAFTFILLILILGWYWNTKETTLSNVEVENTIEAVMVEEVQNSSPTVITDTDIESKSAAEEVIPQIKISPLSLVLVGKKDAWIQLTIDEQKAQEIQLKKGEKYEWPADQIYELTMTTGSTASVYLNGEEIEIKEDMYNKLYQTRLNKFSLTRLNN
ncbi:MAG: hypothetical protein COB67_12205 [SAR324 cluster bacterium]|uniref:DUF4115 domain-containing protein n=1 Tax=SAR324 cluster bacterium TaxID=2024889 RepID=A0A2A4SRK6_9DELT|nr:MAG: hypothetical protein COB67_12205 [SAR324 cluster bacterium]